MHRPIIGGTAAPTLLLMAAYAALATHVLFFGRPNADEGFYALISSEVMQGKLLYRDIAYTQTPLLPYLQGVALSVIGFGVFEQRLLNLLLSTTALGLALHLWKKRKLPTSDWLPLATLWVSSIPILYFCTIGKTYAMTQLALLVAAAALVSPGKPLPRLVLLSLAGVVAVGCRLPSGPSVFILWAAFAFQHRRALPFLSLLGVPLAIALLAFAPLILPAPANAWFWTLAYHGASAIPHAPFATLVELAVTASGIALLAILSFAAVTYRKFNVPIADLCVFQAGLAGAVLNVALSGVYTEYAVPFLGLILLGGGLLLHDLQLRRCTTALGFTACLGANALSFAQIGGYHDTSNYLADVRAAAAFVAAHTPPQGPVLTPMPEVALAAGRPVVPRSEMGKFAITAEMEPTEAFARNIIYFGELVFIVESRYPAAVVLSANERWNFRRSIPSLRWISDPSYQQFERALASRYVRAYSNSSFVVYLPRPPTHSPSPQLKDTGTADSP